MPLSASKRRSDANSPSVSFEIGTIATGNTGAYVGRFAPSPTGPLHFGSLLTAVASYLQARVASGKWLLRIEDIDPPREQPEATDLILSALRRYGFEWDGPVSYQSQSRAAHDAAIQRLLDAGLAYPCGCSRRDLAAALRGPLGVIYPGRCRAGSNAAETAIRVRTNDEAVCFSDGLQGCRSQCLESESGDFIIRRRDGLIAYQLAVVVDDCLQGITEVVRGIDLIESTARQIWLQRLLGYAEPRYQHIPVAVNVLDQKLSKSHGAGAVSISRAAETLVAALGVLGQQPPEDLAASKIEDIWVWARANWRIDVLQGRTRLPVAHMALAHSGNRLS